MTISREQAAEVVAAVRDVAERDGETGAILCRIDTPEFKGRNIHMVVRIRKDITEDDVIAQVERVIREVTATM
ncbi:MAG TPA: hypothetical protein VF174_17140 [Micromonosporaceae bacterium]